MRQARIGRADHAIGLIALLTRRGGGVIGKRLFQGQTGDPRHEH